MIAEAAVFLRDELSRYLQLANAVDKKENVLLGNISALETQENNLANKVVISLVNIEEESTLKNGKNYIKNPVKTNIESISPPVHLNLYFLFTATLSTDESKIDDSYQSALRKIATIIEFFQAKRYFTLQNSAGFSPTNLDESKLTEMRLVPELFTLTFEQINHLWGSLGGKQSPFIMYKVRLVKIQSQISAEAPLIESIRAESKELFTEKLDQVERFKKTDDDN